MNGHKVGGNDGEVMVVNLKLELRFSGCIDESQQVLFPVFEFQREIFWETNETLGVLRVTRIPALMRLVSESVTSMGLKGMKKTTCAV